MTHLDYLGWGRHFLKYMYSFTHKQLCAWKLAHILYWKELHHMPP